MWTDQTGSQLSVEQSKWCRASAPLVVHINIFIFILVYHQFFLTCYVTHVYLWFVMFFQTTGQIRSSNTQKVINWRIITLCENGKSSMVFMKINSLFAATDEESSKRILVHHHSRHTNHQNTNNKPHRLQHWHYTCYKEEKKNN